MKNKQGLEEIGYIYTIMISSLLLTVTLFATSNTSNDVIRQKANSEIRDITLKIADSVNGIVEISNKNPNSNMELIVEMPKTVKSYYYTIALENSTVKTESNIGIIYEVNLHNIGNLNTSGNVSSSYSFVKVIYQKDYNRIIIKGA